jgi:hypothetical protein
MFENTEEAIKNGQSKEKQNTTQYVLDIAMHHVHQIVYLSFIAQL